MIAVGKISKSVGIKGEVKILPLTESPERFGKLKSVWIGKDEAGALKFSVEHVRVSSVAIVLRLDGIQTRTAADELRGQLVYVADAESVRPRKGSYFIHEIVGMKVVNEAGETIGTLEEVMQLPANDVWVVRAGEKEFLIPAIKEVIRSVDAGQKVIVIRPMEGLLD